MNWSCALSNRWPVAWETGVRQDAALLVGREGQRVLCPERSCAARRFAPGRRSRNPRSHVPEVRASRPASALTGGFHSSVRSPFGISPERQPGLALVRTWPAARAAFTSVLSSSSRSGWLGPNTSLKRGREQRGRRLRSRCRLHHDGVHQAPYERVRKLRRVQVLAGVAAQRIVGTARRNKSCVVQRRRADVIVPLSRCPGIAIVPAWCATVAVVCSRLGQCRCPAFDRLSLCP